VSELSASSAGMVLLALTAIAPLWDAGRRRNLPACEFF